MTYLITEEIPSILSYVRRPSPAPSVPVALGARSVLWQRFLPGEHEDNLPRPWVKLLWGISGTGAVRIEGRVHDLPPGYVALFLPGMHHEAWVPADRGEVWELRWCTLDGPLCAQVAGALGLSRAGVWHAGPAPSELFERLREAVIASVTPEGERLADVAAYALLARVAYGIPLPPADLAVDRAIGLIRERWGDADFGIGQLAHAVGLHRSALSRRFHAVTGLSPSAYLTNLRMQHALSLLRTTDLTVARIARRCGFADADYFTRLFRRVQDVTPTAYRG